MLPSFHPTVGWCARRGWSGCLLVSSTRKDRRLLREQRKKCTFLLSAAREKRAEKYSPRIIVRRTMINFSISWNQRKNSILFLLVYSLTLSDEYLNVCSKKRKKGKKNWFTTVFSLFVCFQFQARSVNEPNRETFLKWNENGKTSED